MATAANPPQVKVSQPVRSAMTVGETLLHMALSAAIPISAVVFVALTL